MEYINWRFCIFCFSLWWVVSSKDQPNDLVVVSYDCQLTEPVYNFTFNLGSLHSDLAHTVKSTKGDKFEFNVCGNLTRTCAGQSNVAGCLTSKGKQYILGTNHKLLYKNGKIYFTFLNGQKCKSDKNYTLNVLVSCDYTLDTVIFTVLPYGDEECSFYVSWRTSHACLPIPANVKSNSCRAVDGKTGHTYNLSPLVEYNHRAIDRNGSYFVINVCKPVLYGHNSMCPPGSSICFVNQTITDHKKKFHNYGTVQPNPIVENGQLLMRHPSDTVCNATHNITSTIYFSCDQNIKYGEPDFIRRKGCDYEFSWVTSLACAKSKPCTVIDSDSGFEYDFSSFATKVYNISSKDGKQYTLGICSNPGNYCPEDSGICEYKNDQSTSLGMISDQLNLNKDKGRAPFLLYESGSVCNNSTKWSTKIEFVCSDKDGNKDELKIIENSNCQIFIQFQTHLACQNQISCKASGYLMDDKIDLTPLISSTKNYVALVNETLKLSNKNSVKFFLNVCRPLIPEYGLGCSGGSAACKTVMGPRTPEQEQSLGYPDISLVAIDKSRAILKYLKGDPCPAEPSNSLSSSIEFICSYHAGKGTPILQSIADECHYKFEWPTIVICPSHMCKFNAITCEIINDKLNKSYNLQKADYIRNGQLMIMDNLKFDICNNVSDMKVIADFSQNTVKLFFKTRISTDTESTINVELRLVCSNSTAHRPSLNDNDSSILVITQETADICEFMGFNVIKESHDKNEISYTEPSTKPKPNSATRTTEVTPVTTHTTTSSIVSSKSQSQNSHIIIIIGALVLIWTISVFMLRHKIKKCFRREHARVQYSRVETNEEASVLLLQEGHITDSDDEMLT